MRRVGIKDEDGSCRHGSQAEDMAFMAECALATVEGMESLSRPPVGELRRQRRLARFAVSSLCFHGCEVDQRFEESFGRVAPIVIEHDSTGKLRMPWEEAK